MNIYIYRHGATHESKNNLGYGANVFTAPLLPEGLPIIEKLAQKISDLQTDYNVSSEVERCRKTVAIVEKVTGKTFTYDSRINEFDEYHNESFDDLKKRIKNFLEDVENKRYQNILICTHGAVIAGITSFTQKGDFSVSDIHNYPQTGVLVSIVEGAINYTDFNK